MAEPPKESRESALERGRAAYRASAWNEAYQALLHADGAEPLGREDLDRLAWAATLSGRMQEMIATMERLYRAELDAGEPSRAARAAFWAGMRLTAAGEPGRGSGWFTRAQRLVDELGRDSVERGYLMIPVVHRQSRAGEYEAAASTAAEAATLAERFGDRDLTAFARNLQGKALMHAGRTSEGMAMLDEAMLSVADGGLSPQITGLAYCSVIAACNAVFELERVREWTLALSAWCKAQPELLGFSGTCLVHRSEIMLLAGEWPEAFEEARRAGERMAATGDAAGAADAAYQEAEVHRLRGDFAAAEDGYRRASTLGRDPQPGLALLRLSEGRTDVAVAALRRVLAATEAPLRRARFLPAAIEIELAAGNRDAAREHCRELAELSSSHPADVLSALAGQARGTVELAEGRASQALAPLRAALAVWQRLGAPYEAARLRVELARACKSLGDEDGAALELGAAREAFEGLGATPDLALVDALDAPGLEPARRDTHGLTQRELEVLRHVATGKTNKLIAKELCLSEKTVDRHVSNIFTKLGVPSRAAATAYAYEHQLLGP